MFLLIRHRALHRSQTTTIKYWKQNKSCSNFKLGFVGIIDQDVEIFEPLEKVILYFKSSGKRGAYQLKNIVSHLIFMIFKKNSSEPLNKALIQQKSSLELIDVLFVLIF